MSKENQLSNEGKDLATETTESPRPDSGALSAVEVYDVRTRIYRPAALLRKSAPSKAGEGWYFQWEDSSPSQSSGGWTPARFVRTAALATTPEEGK